MKQSWRRALSALLTLAMVLSLLVIPAAADTVTAKTWDFEIEGMSDNDLITNESTGMSELQFSGIKRHDITQHYGSYGGNGAWYEIPVEGPCNITVTAGYQWSLHVGDDTDFNFSNTINSATQMVYPYTGEAGTVKVHLDGTSYIKSIGVSDYAEVPALRMKEAGPVALKVGETERVEIPLYLRSATAADLTASSTSAAVTATVEADATTGAKLVIATGEVTEATTATVTVAMTGNSAEKVNILVNADPAGEVITTLDAGDYVFATAGKKHEDKTAPAYTYNAVRGMTWTGFSANEQHGAAGANGSTLTLSLPADKYSQLIITTCQHGTGGTPTVDVGTLGTKEFKGGESGAGVTYVVDNATGDTTITFTAGVYVHGITVGAFTDAPAVLPTCDKTSGCTLHKGHLGDCVTSGGGDDPTPDDPTEKTVPAGVHSFQVTDKTSADVDGVTWGEGLAHGGNNHGVQTPMQNETGDPVTVTLNMAKPGAVALALCCYGSGENTTVTVSPSTATVTKGTPQAEDAPLNSVTYAITNVPAGELVITLTPDPQSFVKGTFESGSTATETGANYKGNYPYVASYGIYIHSIEVQYDNGGTVEPEPTGSNKIKVWDFSGKQESNTSLYENMITAQTWKDAGVTDNTAAAALSGDYALNGVTWHESSNNGRLYSNVSGMPTSGTNYGVDKTFDDGFKSGGGIYAGGTSGRYLIIHNLKAGDKVKAYMGSSSGAIDYFAGSVALASEAVKEFEAGTIESFGLREFVVSKDGDFKIWASTGKTFQCRVVVVKPATVSGTITLDSSAAGLSGYTMKFLDQTTGTETAATINNDGTWSAKLTPGHTHTAILVKPGYGFTNACKQVTVTEADSVNGKSGVALTIEAKQNYTLAGQVTGFASGYDISKLKVTLEPDAQSSANGSLPITLKLDSGLAYSETSMEPGVTYTAHLSGVDDYKISSGATITSATSNTTVTQNIQVTLKTTYAASGALVTLDPDNIFAPLYPNSTYAPLTASVSALTFTILDKDGKEDRYTYPATVTGGNYTVNLRPGSYIAKATVNGWATKTHVVVTDKAVSKDLLFVSTATPAAVAYKEKLTVDPSGKGDFKTINGALNAIKNMTRTADQRVTVEIAPGTYREQIAIDYGGKFDNITFANADPTKEVKITWYYGIGYTYYSATGTSSTESWYDAERAFDKFDKPAGDVARWGCTVRVRANGFRAENITFESSFNYYMTAEELVDGVTPTGSKPVRKSGLDVTSKAATERAAAIWMDSSNNRSDKAEFKNCKFLSSQDTLGTGDRAYFKDCYIEGMTDYICGPGSCVFDTCTLNWKGYSDNTGGGYITAPQTKNGTNSPEDEGYLFRNCTVTGDTKLQLGAGGYARMWGGGNTVIYMLNTTLKSTKTNGTDLITTNPWNDMGNGTPVASATGLHEYGTKLADGTAVNLSIRPSNTVLTAAQAAAVKPETFFGSDWTPYYYTAETATSVALDGDPSVTDNGDINLPKPGHTLTVSYTLTPADAAANDASTIQWYTVKDGVEKLVKTSAATDKTYQIQSGDVGAQIKVTVTPKTIGGLVGDAKSVTVAEAVVEGYDDPSGATDPVLGKGVNVYLAGDSTVRDYSALGMWSKGTLQSEGSWGEFLGQFFNDKVTVVNYANGGRTTRSFIEQDGSLAKIDATIKEGDFLIVQFGHNDCYTGDNRYVPLGIAKNSPQKSYAEGGVYPDTVTYSSDLKNGSTTLLTAGTHTTYTGYLKKYIEVTQAHGATAVLATPVSRLQYSSDGKSIKTHHDATAIDGTSDNEYCKAVKWVYDWAVDRGYKVEFLDNYALTEQMFLDAWANGSKSTTTAYQAMKWDESKSTKYDGTHNSKLGGLMEAALVAQAIQNKGWTISKAVVAPTDVQGDDVGNKIAFTISADGKLAAFDNKNMAYTDHATYWEGYGQKLFDAIAAKAAELNPGGDEPDDPTPPDCEHAETEVRGAKEATCTEAGYTGDTYCKECNKLIQKGTAIAKIPHTYGEDDVCTVCGAKKSTGSSSRPSDRNPSSDPVKPDPGTTEPSTTTPAADDVKVEKTETATKADGTKVTTTQLSNGSTAVTEVTLDGAVSVDVTNKDGEKIVAIDVPAEIPVSETKFEDVTEEHWAAEAIDRMAALGMVRGVSEGIYNTDGEVTRATLATMLFRFSNGAEGKETTFADVPSGEWYADAIGWANAAGVVTGYSETAFGPNDQLTREQMAVMLLRFAKLIGMDSSVDADAVASFSDADSVNSWAADGMAWCVKNGIINGMGDNVLAPGGSATRAQTAVMLDRFIGLLK